MSFGSRIGSSLTNARAGVGLHEIGEAAVAGEAGELAVLAVHVVPRAASMAQAAGHERVADHRVPDLDVGYRRADLLDPAGVLVSEHVGQERIVRVLYGLPLSLDDVYVRAAQPRRPDAYDHIERTLYLGERTLYLGFFYLLDLEALLGNAVVIAVQPRGLHSVA